MENKELELLTDIAKLLKKYGASVFDDLAHLLKDEEFTTVLPAILNKYSEEGKKHNLIPNNKKNKPLLKIREQLVSLKITDNEKAVILLEFYDKIYAQGISLKLAEIKNFAFDIGFDLSKTKAKDDAISKLINSLMTCTINQISDFLKQFKFSQSGGDRSLEGWSNIILKKDRNDDLSKK